MAQPNVHGRFVWQELIVQDTAAAAAFYSKVVGWRTQVPPAMPDYTVFAAGSEGVAGLQRLSGARAHWLPYIGARDVDETAAAAVRLGGKLVKAPCDLPNGGRLAELADPQGAGFGIYHSKQPGTAPADPTKPGQFSWQELATTDYEAAFKFYSELFGWQAMDRMTMGPSQVYLIFGWDGMQQGGIYKPSKPGMGTQWLPYATVTDIDATVAAVAKAGGQIVHGPVPVPGGGRIAQLLDASGALFAVHSFAGTAPAASVPKPAAKPAPAKPPAPTAPAPAAAPPKAAAAKQPVTTPAAPPKPAPAKPATKNAAPKKPVAKKPAAKKAAAKKAAAKKAAPKKAARKKPAARKAARKPMAKKQSPKKKGKAKSGKRPAARRASAKRRPASAARRKK